MEENRMKYICSFSHGRKTEQWQGEIRLLSTSDTNCELTIRGRGSYFHVITGTYSLGRFIWIPNHDVGSELASYQDVFWNKERLTPHLGAVDAATVASGLQYLPDLTQEN